MEQSTQLVFVPIDLIRLHWPMVRYHIMEAANRAGEMSEQDIVYELLTCQMQLLCVVEGERLVAALTGKVRDDVAWIVHMGGDYQKTKNHFPEFELWARALGATRLRIQGRKGWVRQLKEYGFKEKHVTLEKTL